MVAFPTHLHLTPLELRNVPLEKPLALLDEQWHLVSSPSHQKLMPLVLLDGDNLVLESLLYQSSQNYDHKSVHG